MNMQKLKNLAKGKIGSVCRVCPICNGFACRGEVPGMGGTGMGSSFQNNVSALQNIKLNMRTTHNITSPDTSCNILGIKMGMPIIGAPIGGLAFNLAGFATELEYAEIILAACKNVGSFGMTGDGKDRSAYTDGLKAIEKIGLGIPTVKPRPNSEIIEHAKKAEQAGAQALAIDVDAAALINMTVSGQPISGKTVADMQELKRHISIPLIIKGIMTPECALNCVQAGIDALVVSNHGGRVLDCTPGTAEVLPLIKKAVGDKITILVDGGIRSGSDVLKMLALGADAVMLGRTVAFGACGGTAGVEFLLRKMQAELVAAMIMTGCQNIGSIDARALYKQ